jgi:hypothetical protein
MADRERSQSHRDTITVLYRLRAYLRERLHRAATRRFDITDTARTTLRRSPCYRCTLSLYASVIRLRAACETKSGRYGRENLLLNYSVSLGGFLRYRGTNSRDSAA